MSVRGTDSENPVVPLVGATYDPADEGHSDSGANSDHLASGPNDPGPVSGRRQFPFSAVVGQPDLQLALLLGAVDRDIGGVLLRGDKGSAKTTLARGLAELLPGAPFVELPLGVSEDRVLGTIDLRAALIDGERRFAPGLLAEADGGVLYVDEVNLLPDHVVDVLLDVAVSGVNRVEREGVAHVHHSRFVLIGSMNPEEGELRPQLLDRFGLSVDVRALVDPVERSEAVLRRMDFDADPDKFVEQWHQSQSDLRARLTASTPAVCERETVEAVSALCVLLGAESLRADLVCCRAAGALAGWEGRSVVTSQDVGRVAGLALGHRRRLGPFDTPGLAEEELDRALDQVFGRDATGERPGSASASATSTRAIGQQSGLSGSNAHSGSNGSAGDRDVFGSPDDTSRTGSLEPTGQAGSPERVGREGVAAGNDHSGPDGAAHGNGPVAPIPVAPIPVAPIPVAPIPVAAIPVAVPDLSLSRNRGSASKGAPALRGGVTGGRSVSDSDRGRIVGHRPLGEPGQACQPYRPESAQIHRDSAKAGRSGSVTLAASATVMASVARRSQEIGSSSVADGVLLEAQDLRQNVYQAKRGHLVILAVDASGSMGADQRMAAAKGAVLSLLTHAYQRRDRVALVIFGGDGAQVVLRPTGSVEIAQARLESVVVGGRTPLAAGLQSALDLAEQSLDANRPALVVVVSDGRATAGPKHLEPFEAAMEVAGRIARRGIEAVVLDAETGPIRLGLGATLAQAMRARHIAVDQLTSDGISKAVRALIDPR